MAMIAIIATMLKWAVVPGVKKLYTDLVCRELHWAGYTPLYIAYTASIGLSFLYKAMFNVGVWGWRDIVMTILVGIFAAASAVGGNTTIQAIKGNDVSIVKSW
jgi:hypothetical protein